MQNLSFGPVEISLLAIALLVLLVVAGLALGRRRRREAAAEAATARQVARAAAVDGTTRLPAGREAGGPGWSAPQQPAPPQPAGGPSLSVGIMGLRRASEVLEVAWNAINDGSVPLAVQWGQPVVEFDGKRICLRYTWAGDGEGPDAPSFTPPRSRVCGPREILSRTVTIDWPAGSRDRGGLEVQVLVGYGPADTLLAASMGSAAYQAWQKTAATRPRPVPALRPAPQP